MENSYEALYIGVYLFVFVAAMTIAVYLFQGVNDLADRSYDYGKVVEGNAVIETDTDEMKYLSREDVISYYMNYIAKDNGSKPGFKIVFEGKPQNYNYKNLINNLPADAKYKLTLEGDTFKIKKVD